MDDAVVYCDPPYRNADTSPYRHVPDWTALEEVLRAQTGRVAVSGYGDDWDSLGWRSAELPSEVRVYTAGEMSKLDRNEKLWMNLSAARGGAVRQSGGMSMSKMQVRGEDMNVVEVRERSGLFAVLSAGTFRAVVRGPKHGESRAETDSYLIEVDGQDAWRTKYYEIACAAAVTAVEAEGEQRPDAGYHQYHRGRGHRSGRHQSR